MPGRPDMLIDPDGLAQRLGQPGLKILECTAHLQPQPVGASRYVSGRPEFDADHIPGAQHVDMRDQMSDPQGRYPYTLPDAQRIDAQLAALGIGADDDVVLYSRGGVMSATRVWYVLHTLGFSRLALLDGGYERWVAEGKPVWRRTADGTVPSQPSQPTVGAPFHARLDPQRIADKTRVQAALSEPDTLLVNALTRQQFDGSGGAHYGRPGRIPGSVSVPARELTSAQTGRFLPADELRARFAQAGVLDAKQVIVYCGGGIAATVDAFVLEMLGHPGWAVYDNSLLEWSTQAELPMQLG